MQSTVNAFIYPILEKASIVLMLTTNIRTQISPFLFRLCHLSSIGPFGQ